VKKLAAIAACMLSACSGVTSSAAQHSAQRIVSLIPSFTEDLCAIGAGPQLVGVSKYSDIPCARGLPRVADFQSVDAERIVALHPDLVVAIPAQERFIAPLQQAGIRVVVLPDDSYQQIFTDIDRLGTLTGQTAGSRKLVAQLQNQTRAVHQAAHFARRPRVFVALGTGPIWTAGPLSYISTLIGIAGGTNAVTKLSAAYAPYSAEALLALQPDAIVSDRATDLAGVLNREPWRSLHAVQQHHVFILDDPDILERPGPRYVDGLAWLVDRLRTLRH
jgi:ABC-type Fe3+-hydroxamate transport system substrate-binding protein